MPVTDAILRLIADNCAMLYHLNLENCRDITQMGVDYVVEQCRWLGELLLTGTGLDETYVTAMEKRFPRTI
jgi:hypothetical protein